MIFHFLANVQALANLPARASVKTEIDVVVKEIIETGRLVGGVTARLVGLLQFFGSNGRKQRGKQ
jgi:hypothetical protein